MFVPTLTMDCERFDMSSKAKISEALNNWRYGETMVEIDQDFSLEILAIFDHDLRAHLLVLEFDSNSKLEFEIISLWFLTSDDNGDQVNSFVKQWNVSKKLFVPPFAEAAAIVEDWYRLYVEDNRKRYG